MSDKEKTVLFSVTRKDCDWDYYSGTGAGGQHRNKHQNCVRVHHKPSGARGNCQEHRERKSNERKAFERMAKTPEMTKWLRMETAKQTGALAEAEGRAAELMRPSNMRVECKRNGKWVDWEEPEDDNKVA